MSIDEWDQRQPCPDGACIGLIGSDGLCKVCGRAAPNWGDERKRGLAADAASEDEDDDDDDDEYDDEEAGDVGDDDEDDDDDDDDLVGESDSGYESAYDDDAKVEAADWGKRRLCSDGACIGVIGENGKCTVCGSPP